MAGGGDQAANAVGVGAVGPGVVALSLGTSGVVFATTEPAAARSARARSTRSAMPCPGRWHMMTVMLSAAGSLRWFRDALAPGRGLRRARRRPPRRAGRQRRPAFLPYLTGERSPHPDPLARGAFVGLTVGHDRRHLTRAVLEGVAFGLRDGLDQMIAAGMPAPGPGPRVRRRDGEPAVAPDPRRRPRGARSPRSATTEGAAYGAALLAAVGAGWFPTVEAAAAAVVPVTPVAAPGPDAAGYAEAHAAYRELYPALAPTFHAARLRRPSGAPAARGGSLHAALPAQLDGRLAPSRSPRSGFLPRMIMPEDVVRRDVRLVDRVHDAAVVHDADPVRQVEDVVDVVADEEDADALAP